MGRIWIVPSDSDTVSTPKTVRKAAFDDMNITQNVEIFNNISAPVTKGQKIGELTFTLDGNEIARVDLVANADVPKYSFFTMTKRVFEDWFTLLKK